MQPNNMRVILALLTTLAASPALATTVEVASVPQGIITYTLPATGSGNVTSYFSLPLSAAPVYTGTVSTVTATTISVADATAPFVNTTGGTQLASLATAAQPYFVKFVTGAEAGRVVLVTSNTSSSLTLDTTDHSTQTTPLTTSGFAVTAGSTGDSFELFPGDTLALVLGSTASQVEANGVTPSASLFSADTIGVYNVSLLNTLSYYFNSTTNFWETSGSASNVNNTILYPYSSITVTRRQNRTAASLALSGTVPDVAQVYKTTGSNAVIYSSTQYPVDVPFSTLNFGPNWVQGTSVFSDDTVGVWNPSLLNFDTYYQLTDSTWRKVGVPGTNVDSTVIPAGTVLTILKRAPVSGASSFLQSVLPYSLN